MFLHKVTPPPRGWQRFFFFLTLDFPLVSLFPPPSGLSEGELSGTGTELSETGTTTQSAGLAHTTPLSGGQVSTKPAAVTRGGGDGGMEPKHLIFKREKLRLGGRGGGEKGTQTKVCNFWSFSGLQPLPLILPLLFSPTMPGETGSIYP